jgi:predicted molibdopterin-dependent oxidoreductase YjgC
LKALDSEDLAAKVESEVLAVPVSILYDRGLTVLPTTLLNQRIPEPYIVLHPETTADPGFNDGAKVRIEIESYEVVVTARLDETIPVGVVLVPRSMGVPVHEPAAIKLSLVQEVVA